MLPATRNVIGAAIFVTIVASVIVVYVLPERNNNTQSFIQGTDVKQITHVNPKQGPDVAQSGFRDVLSKFIDIHSLSLAKLNKHLQLKKKIPNKNIISETPKKNKTGFSLAMYPHERMGNQMFEYASLLGIASTNKRTPFILQTSKCRVCNTFQISHIKHKNDINISKFKRIKEKANGKYDTRLTSLPDDNLVFTYSYLQSYKYFKDIEPEVRKELRFTPPIDVLAAAMFGSVFTSGSGVVTVGVHVRRGDYVHHKRTVEWGVLVPSKTYFNKAMNYFRNKYDNVKFLVATNGREWTRANVRGDDVVLLKPERPEVHMATLAKCDHVVMSVGTFGWWAAYLAGGDVTYFTPPFRKGSYLDGMYEDEDFFPPAWIEMGN